MSLIFSECPLALLTAQAKAPLAPLATCKNAQKQTLQLSVSVLLYSVLKIK